MKVAVCFSGLPRGPFLDNLEVYKKIFDGYDFFYSLVFSRHSYPPPILVIFFLKTTLSCVFVMFRSPYVVYPNIYPISPKRILIELYIYIYMRMGGCALFPFFFSSSSIVHKLYNLWA